MRSVVKAPPVEDSFESSNDESSNESSEKTQQEKEDERKFKEIEEQQKYEEFKKRFYNDISNNYRVAKLPNSEKEAYANKLLKKSWQTDIIYKYWNSHKYIEYPEGKYSHVDLDINMSKKDLICIKTAVKQFFRDQHNHSLLSFINHNKRISINHFIDEYIEECAVDYLTHGDVEKKGGLFDGTSLDVNYAAFNMSKGLFCEWGPDPFMKKINMNTYVIELPAYVNKCLCDIFIDECSNQQRNSDCIKCICSDMQPSSVMKNIENMGRFIELELIEYSHIIMIIHKQIPMVDRFLRSPIPKPKSKNIIYQTWNCIPTNIDGFLDWLGNKLKNKPHPPPSENSENPHPPPFENSKIIPHPPKEHPSENLEESPLLAELGEEKLNIFKTLY